MNGKAGEAMAAQSDETYFDSLLSVAIRHGASDIHLLAGLPPALRINGEMRIFPGWRPLEAADLNSLTAWLLTKEQLERVEREREISISHLSAVNGRFRVTVYHRLGVREMAIRIAQTHIQSWEELGLPPAVNEFIANTAGMILVTGPTGSGKTTTLNYLVDAINNSISGKIVTVEDPVEFSHRHRRCIVTQIEVGTDTADFASFLRSALRLDPDVIVIGEMRDQETISTALTAAETGHLVLATLHTPSAVGTAERIINVFPGNMQRQIAVQTAATLIAVVSQRLIPTVEKDRRVLATEVLFVNTAVRHMIREQSFHKLRNVLVTGGRSGMHTLEQNLADLYRNGVITRAMAYAHANSISDLDALLKNPIGDLSAPQQGVLP
jgi:twitching motility protein PilT